MEKPFKPQGPGSCAVASPRVPRPQAPSESDQPLNTKPCCLLHSPCGRLVPLSSRHYPRSIPTLLRHARTRRRDILGTFPPRCSPHISVGHHAPCRSGGADKAAGCRHDISTADKKAYLKANRCLLESPQKLNRLPGAKTRWDELVSLHQIHALQIHTTGQFLPYHRYYLKTLEFLLRECGYKGAMP